MLTRQRNSGQSEFPSNVNGHQPLMAITCCLAAIFSYYLTLNETPVQSHNKKSTRNSENCCLQGLFGTQVQLCTPHA